MFLPGMYPLTIDAMPNALETYCLKLEQLLTSDHFDESLKKVTAVFKQCEQKWISMEKSRYAMKDTKDFTDELTRICREIFVNKTQSIENAPSINLKNGLMANIILYK